MNNGFVCVVSFVSGAAIGILATRKYFDERYKQIANDEIASVREVFSKRHEAETKNENEKKEIRIDHIQSYNNVINQERYISQEPLPYCVNDDSKAVDPNDKIYTISPEEFGELEDYDKISLTLYADGILADDMDNVIDDLEDTVGDFNSHFGEYEDDAVFVRNEIRKCDYEILANSRKYADLS